MKHGGPFNKHYCEKIDSSIPNEKAEIAQNFHSAVHDRIWLNLELIVVLVICKKNERKYDQKRRH